MKSEAFKYLVIGGCTTLVNLVAYAIFVKGFKWNVTLSNILSISISIIFAYITNKLIVFQSHCANIMGVINECAKFVGARLATMVIEVGGVFLTVNLIGQDAMIGKLETQVIVIVGNYFISKFFVFKD
jgi:putative flippase GtrA